VRGRGRDERAMGERKRGGSARGPISHPFVSVPFRKKRYPFAAFIEN